MKSHSSGCTDRVTMSTWSWRSLRSSAQPIAAVPSPTRPRREARYGRLSSAEPPRETPTCARTPESSSFALDRVAGRAREDVLEVRRVELREQLRRRALRDKQAVVHD